MSAIREELGHLFEEYRANADDAQFCWDRIGTYNRDELLALIWWLCEDRKREREMPAKPASELVEGWALAVGS